MTAPTPDVQDISSRAARVTSADWGVVPLMEIVRLAADDIPALVNALAAVAAERDRERAQHEATKSTLDQAWADLHAEKQMREETRVLLDQALTERDQARQMLADAPHDYNCLMRIPVTMRIPEDKCTCWKAGL